MICTKSLPVLAGCALIVAAGLLSGSAAAEDAAPAAPPPVAAVAPAAETPAATPAPAAPATVAAPAPADARPVLERWAQAVADKLAKTDAAAPAIQPLIGAGPSLKPNARGLRVDRLAAQLQARGFLAADGYHGFYDPTLESAVAAYQTSEGMIADGVAGEGTIESLDRDPALAAAALKSSLDGMRSLAADAPPEFFLVNIPSQTAYLIQGATVTMSMRTAVGRPSRPTPLLTDQVTDVVINPTWTAPTTVLAKDKLPNLRRTHHPGIEGATIWLDKQEVDPATVDWSTVTADRIRIVQSPGDQNALGRFKFNLTNGQSIYMHDTNDHSVFERQGRALSSGCVRLAEPRKLAENLLGRDGWTSDRIDNALDSERTQYVGLHHRLPVRMVYWLASVDDKGAVHVHKDIYHHLISPRPAAPAIAAVAPAAPAAITTPAPAAPAPAATVPAAPVAEAPHRSKTAHIAPPRRLIFSQPVSTTPVVAPAAVAPAPAAESDGLEGLFNKLVAFVKTMPSGASQPAATGTSISSINQPQLEHVAAQDAHQGDRAHCTESCGWGLY
ncbi:MAG: L,D-transpeptidase family protein [Rhodospirillaceae bacterium]